MTKLVKVLKAIHKDEEGATTTEYIIIVALVAIALIAVITTFGEQIAAMFTTSSDELEAVEGTSY